MTHGDPQNPTKNPHRVKRYEITATADAPGPWDAVKGSISYEVINHECTPENKFLGVHIGPQDVSVDIAMARVDEKTWRGYFYRDLIEDDNYYDLGICHWDATSVGGVFRVHNETFGSGDTLRVLLEKGPQTMLFKRSDFLDRTSKDGGYGTSAQEPDANQHPDAFFPIKITVREATQ